MVPHLSRVESKIQHCLLLPLVQNDRGTTTKYAVIFDDWDVGDEYFGKGMPTIYEKCFEANVL